MADESNPPSSAVPLHARQLAQFLLALRKSLLWVGIAVAGTSLAFYFAAPALLAIFQGHLGQKLAFFAVAEPFIALVKLSFFAAVFVLIPWMAYCIGQALARPFGLSPGTVAAFVIAAWLLFYLGVAFCYFVTLPLGVKFLLGYQTAQLKPVIAVSRFVSFITLFLAGFGAIFELPLLMVFVGKVGLCHSRTFARYRRHAVLAISVLAALLTPTPDIINMMLMGVPLYLLYEAGIAVLRLLRL